MSCSFVPAGGSLVWLGAGSPGGLCSWRWCCSLLAVVLLALELFAGLWVWGFFFVSLCVGAFPRTGFSAGILLDVLGLWLRICFGRCTSWLVLYCQTGATLRRHFLRAVAAAVFLVHVAAATSASCRGTSQQNIAIQMFLQLQTFYRVLSRWAYPISLDPWIFSSKVTSALRVTGGTIVVVGCIEGLRTVLRCPARGLLSRGQGRLLYSRIADGVSVVAKISFVVLCDGSILCDDSHRLQEVLLSTASHGFPSSQFFPARDSG